MKKHITQFFILISLFFGTKMVAQNPNWSLNSSDFQFSMTLTTFLNVDGRTLTSTNDKVSAYVGSEIRGVANVVYVANSDKYVAFLSVFANTNNETITFKMYDSTNDEVVNVSKSINFQSDVNLGSVFQSFSIANPALSSTATLNDFGFQNIPENTLLMSGNNYDFELPSGVDVTNLVPEFTSSNNSKVFIDKDLQKSGTSVVDFTNIQTYQVLSEDESTLTEYTIEVDVAVNIGATTTTIWNTSSLNTNQNSNIISISFSNSVSDLSLDDFDLTNAVATNLTKTNAQNYTVEIIPINNGVFSLFVKAGAVIDADSKSNLQSNTLTYTFDDERPIIINLQLEKQGGNEYFTINFNEPIVNIDANNFELIGTLANNYLMLSLVSISSTEYRFNISKIDEKDGSLFLNLKSTSNIQDSFGNVIVDQNITSFYLDNEGPFAPTLADVIGECSVTLIPPTTEDNCSGEITGTTSDALTYTEQGEYSITWIFDDGNGNVTTAVQRVIVKDQTPPTSPTLADVIGECSVTLIPPTTEDNCSGEITGTTSDALTYTEQGEYEVTWSFDYGNNIILTSLQRVIVKDQTPPTSPTLADVIGECSVTISKIPTTTDNCSGEITGTTSDALTYTEQGEYNVNWIFDDGKGNVTTAVQKVIVKDQTPPEIITNDFQLELDASGSATLNVSDIDNGTFDNCEILSYELSKTNFTLADLGQNSVAFTVRDVSGNESSTSVIVTVTQNSLSTDSFELEKLVTIYPNPVERTLTIQKEQNLTITKIKIFSVNGKEVFSSNYFQKSIHLNNLSSGIYFLKLTTEKGLLIKKFVKSIKE